MARPKRQLALQADAVAADNAIDDPVLVALYELWFFKTNGRAMPARRDFLPGEMIGQLPHVFLIDALDAPRRFRSRLIGTGIVDNLGRDTTGRMINAENYGLAAAGMCQVFDLVCTLRRPVAKKGIVFHRPSRSWASFVALLLPLSSDGVTVDMIFGGMVRIGASPQQPAPPSDNVIWLEAFSDPAKGTINDPVINGRTHDQYLRRASASAA